MAGHRSSNKKLEEAGRYLSGAAVNQQLEKELDEELEEAVELMGADREAYRAQQIDRKDVMKYELFSENVKVFNLFQTLLTQMEYVSGATSALPKGFNYASVIAYLDRFYPEEEVKPLMQELQIIENAYIRASNA